MNKTKIAILVSIFIAIVLTTSLAIYFTTREISEPIVSYELDDLLIISFPIEHEYYISYYEKSDKHDNLYFIDVVYDVKPSTSILMFETLTDYLVRINFLFFNYSIGINLITSDINVYFSSDFVYERELDFNFDYLQLQIKIYVDEIH